MIYTVKLGDTLSSIAKEQLGSLQAVNQIVELNHLADPNQIFVGQKLTLPPEQAPAKEQIATVSSPQNRPSVSSFDFVELTPPLLMRAVPKLRSQRVDDLCSALNEVLPRYQIVGTRRQAHFLAQVGHESMSFLATTENLNYSATALQSTFGKYFPTDALAEAYARQPEKIANRVYADRMGNGSESSGDGWRYRGRGFIQLTGKDNYRRFASDTGTDVVSQPDLIADHMELAVGSACWYWQSRNINRYADGGSSGDPNNIVIITKLINGGVNGLADRTDRFEQAMSALAS